MKNRFFSKKLYLQSLKRLRTVGLAMVIAIVLINAVIPISAIMDNSRYNRQVDEWVAAKYDSEGKPIYIDGVYYDSEGNPLEPGVFYDSFRTSPVTDAGFATALWGLVVFAPLLVYIMFSFLNERRHSDFYHSLPQTRVCVYISMTLAILTWIFATIFLSIGVNTLLFSFAKAWRFSVWTVLGNLFFFSALSLFMAGFMAVAMMLTGTVVSNLLIYAFIILFPTYVVVLFTEGLDEITNILPHGYPDGGVLSLERFIPLSYFTGDSIQKNFLADPGMLIYSAVIGVLMFVLAGVLYRIRRSETAGRSAPSGLFQHIYRIAVTTAFALLIPFAVFLDGVNEIMLILAVFVVVVYILYELVTTRKIKKMVRSLPLLAIPFALALVFTGAVYGARAYVYSVTPEPNEVSSVVVVSANQSNYGYVNLKDRELYDPEIIAYFTEALEQSIAREKGEEGYPNDSFEKQTEVVEAAICLKNGKILHRRLVFRSDAWKAVCLTPEASAVYLKLPTLDMIHEVEMNVGGYYLPAEKAHFWMTLESEFAQMTDEEKYRFMNVSWNSTTEFAFHVTVKGLDEYNPSYYSYLTFYLSPELTPKTLSLFMGGYGKNDELLETLANIRDTESTREFTLYIKEGDYYSRYRYVTKEDFFSVISLDSHLFDEKGTPVILVYDNPYCLYLDEAEYKALLGKLMGIEEPIID